MSLTLEIGLLAYMCFITCTWRLAKVGIPQRDSQQVGRFGPRDCSSQLVQVDSSIGRLLFILFDNRLGIVGSTMPRLFVDFFACFSLWWPCAFCQCAIAVHPE